jgi:hypothetical protein
VRDVYVNDSRKLFLRHQGCTLKRRRIFDFEVSNVAAGTTEIMSPSYTPVRAAAVELRVLSFNYVYIPGVHRHQTTKLCMVPPNVCGCSVWNLLHVNAMKPVIFRCLSHFCTQLVEALPCKSEGRGFDSR